MRAAPEALNWSAENCTVGRAIAVLGEKWAFLILREVFVGLRRFDDIRARTGVPRQVLTDRLALLVAHGLLRRVPYREPGSRTRHEYRMTEAGFALYPVFIALMDWGDRYLAESKGPPLVAESKGPPLVAEHRDCGAPVHVVLRCEAGHDVGPPRDVALRPGPGARPREPGLRP